MTNNTTMDNIDRAVVLLEDMIAKENDTERKYAMLAARDHMKYAWAYLNHNRNDEAGRYLEAAKKIIKGLVA